MDERRKNLPQQDTLLLETVRGTIEQALVRADIYDSTLISRRNREKFLDLISQYETIASLLARGAIAREYLAKLVAERLAERPGF